jgi:hypothetical protein
VSAKLAWPDVDDLMLSGMFVGLVHRSFGWTTQLHVLGLYYCRQDSAFPAPAPNLAPNLAESDQVSVPGCSIPLPVLDQVTRAKRTAVIACPGKGGMQNGNTTPPKSQGADWGYSRGHQMLLRTIEEFTCKAISAK